jgi:general secretion pathway protein G
VAAAAEQYRNDTGHWPALLDDLLDEGPAGLGPYLHGRDVHDVWGRRLFYGADPHGRGFTVFSLGRDGRLGGRGVDSDIGNAVPDDSR